MSTAELKLKLELTQMIAEIEEGWIIRGLKEYFDFELSEEEFELTQKQKDRIEMARKEYSKGEIRSSEEVENNFDQWLSEE